MSRAVTLMVLLVCSLLKPGCETGHLVNNESMLSGHSPACKAERTACQTRGTGAEPWGLTIITCHDIKLGKAGIYLCLELNQALNHIFR